MKEQKGTNQQTFETLVTNLPKENIKITFTLEQLIGLDLNNFWNFVSEVVGFTEDIEPNTENEKVVLMIKTKMVHTKPTWKTNGCSIIIGEKQMFYCAYYYSGDEIHYWKKDFLEADYSQVKDLPSTVKSVLQYIEGALKAQGLSLR